MTIDYTVPLGLISTNANESSCSLVARVFDLSLQARYGIDKVSATIYSSSHHPGILPPEAALMQAQAFIARQDQEHRPKLQRTSAKGNHYIKMKRDLVSNRYLVGPWSYAMLSTFSGNRRLRRILMQSSCLNPYDPPIESLLGNVIHPDHLIDLDWADMPAMCQAETVTTLLTLADDYAQACSAIFGVNRLGRIDTSLTGIEVGWEIPHVYPEGLIRSFARAVSANLMPRPRANPATWATIRAPMPLPPIYMLVGLSPRFKLVAYPKLPASPGGLGVSRFEFRFDKVAIKKIIGTTVLSKDREGIEMALAMLADYAWTYLQALEDDRTAPTITISPPDMLHAVGGLRNQTVVREVLDILATDGKIKTTNRNSRVVARFEKEGWLRRLLFRRPAYRKLAPGLDLSAWRQNRLTAPETITMAEERP